MAYWMLTYELSDDYLEKRGQVRAAHLAGLLEYERQGKLAFAGALGGERPDRAHIIFLGETPDDAKAWAEADPYRALGLIKSWRVDPYNAVCGVAHRAIQP